MTERGAFLSERQAMVHLETAKKEKKRGGGREGAQQQKLWIREGCVCHVDNLDFFSF